MTGYAIVLLTILADGRAHLAVSNLTGACSTLLKTLPHKDFGV
jgi:hypothetical protein